MIVGTLMGEGANISAPISAASTIGPNHDAIVVGTGLGGASLALSLCRAGMRVLSIELGDFLRPPTKAAEAT